MKHLMDEMLDANKIEFVPSIKYLALAVNVKPTILYSVVRAAKPDWNIVQQYMERFIIPDLGVNSLEDIVQKACELQMENRKSYSRQVYKKLPNVTYTLYGKKYPPRRGNYKIGDTVKIREDDRIYEVVYLTDTHIVLKDTETTYVVSYANTTFNNREEREYEN